MPKRIVVCCDGTWNTPDQRSHDKPTPTNITKLALVISDHDANDMPQHTLYHAGVGTETGEKIRGGLFGFGLDRDIRDAYSFLVEEFEPGDELFFFGFSRGAFTARSAAGLVRNCGILRRDHASQLDHAYALYRDRSPQTHPNSTAARLFRQSYSHETDIHFIGVFDTVGALGIPLSGVSPATLYNRRYQFHDVQLSSRVHAAYHALAIDEHRKPFIPTLWVTTPTPGQIVEQAWFAGVHCNVGGGYPDHDLSDIPFLWIIDKAEHHGLAINEAELRAGPLAGDPNSADTGAPHPNPNGQPGNSMSFFYRLLGPVDRIIGKKPRTDDATQMTDSPDSTQAVAPSVAQRSNYMPKNLAAYRARTDLA